MVVTISFLLHNSETKIIGIKGCEYDKASNVENEMSILTGNEDC